MSGSKRIVDFPTGPVYNGYLLQDKIDGRTEKIARGALAAGLKAEGLAWSPDLANPTDVSKGSALIGHGGTSVRAKILEIEGDISGLDSRVAVVEGGQAAGAIGKETRALLEADLAHAEDTVAIVTNDPTVENNTTYRKIGASGAGSWAISSGTPLDAYKTYVSENLAEQTTGLPRSGYQYAIADDSGRVAFGIDDLGRVVVNGEVLTNVGDQFAQLLTHPRSGYVFALQDSEGRTIFGVDQFGRPVTNGEVWAGDVRRDNSRPRSGYQYAIADDSGRVAFGIDDLGRVVVNGEVLSQSEDLAAITHELFPASSICCWGDSMTYGDGVTPYPSQLASILGRDVVNRGFPGETSTMIATRQGGIITLLSVTGNQIPASGPVSITGRTIGMGEGQNYSFPVYGKLGGVHGAMVRTGAESYVFTRTSAGPPVTIIPRTPFLADDDDLSYKTTVIWVGRNNLLEPNRVLRDAKAMVARLSPNQKRYLVLPVCNGAGEGVGTQYYNSIAECNSLLEAEFSANFVDIRRWVVNAYNPGIPQDVTDFADDTTPSSLRTDNVHFTSAGYAIVAQQVATEILNRGW